MERQFVDPAELELRRDSDFLRSLNMVDEGAPVHSSMNECRLIVRHLESIEDQKGFERPSIPRHCQ